MLAQLVSEAARQTNERGHVVSVPTLIRAAVGCYLSRVQRVANPNVPEAV
jgi:hypothetical protein